MNTSNENENPLPSTSRYSVGDNYPRLQTNNSTTAVSVSQIAKLTKANSGLVIHNHKVDNANLVAFITEIICQSRNKLIASVEDYTAGYVIIEFWTSESYPPSYQSTSSDQSDRQSVEDGNIDINKNGDDLFGGLECRKDLMELKEGDYIRVIGRVCTIAGTTKLYAFEIRSIQDPNLITMHILEVIRDSMFYEKRKKEEEDRLRLEKERMEKLPRYLKELSGRELELFVFLKETVPNGGEDGVKLNTIRKKFKLWSKQEINDTIYNIERTGLMWQGESEDSWVPNLAEF